MTIFSLAQLGWSSFYQQQLSFDECHNYFPARLVTHHRTHFNMVSERGEHTLTAQSQLPSLTVGDWVLLDDNAQFVRALNRLSVFSRKAAGTKVDEQLIAANINTIFVTMALNNDFSLNRVERYLALAKAAGAEPFVVLTKQDLCSNVNEQLRQVQAIDPMLMVEAVNALDANSSIVLKPWCRKGNTVAVVGSSGVGKSSLINTLLGRTAQTSAPARNTDDKGRHTTTSKALHILNSGGLLIDTPGMRELQLLDCDLGVQEVFADVESLIKRCRFSDCEHRSEPGCAVLSALEKGQVDARRVDNYFKLSVEQARNSASLAQKNRRERALSQHYRSVQSESRRLKKLSS